MCGGGALPDRLSPLWVVSMIIGIEKNECMRNTEFTDYYCGSISFQIQSYMFDTEF